MKEEQREERENYESQSPLKVDNKFVKPPVEGEEGYGLYVWLQEQD